VDDAGRLDISSALLREGDADEVADDG